MRIRNILPVLLAITAITSCSVYRSGQTPDDVYYSPGRSADDSYLTVDNPRKGRSYSSRYDNTDPNDNYLRMRQYGSRWSTFDDYNDWQYNGGYYGMYSPYTPYSSFYNGFGYTPYGGYGSVFFGTPYAYYNPWSYGSYFNSYYYWNSYYNPYAYGIVVGGAKSNPVYQSVRNFNMRSYTNVNYSNRNRAVSNGRPIYSNQNGRFSTNNTNNGTTGGLRRVYPSNNNNGGYYTPRSTPTYSPAPVRTYTPSSGGGGSMGGGGGGRPSRGH